MRRRIVREALNKIFSEKELRKAITSIDIIGDLAVIKIPREWEYRKYEVGEALLSSLNGVNGVFRQTTPASMEYKVRGMEWLAGRSDTVTIHKEHGCSYKVDLSTVYFSPRLSYERLRIASLVKEGEILVNMFAGVGTFSIIAAVRGGAEKVFSIDKSPEAFKYMFENIIINNLSGKVIPILGDAKDVALDLEGMADRVLMPLPSLALQYLPYAIMCLRDSGWLHLYLHQQGKTRREALNEGIEVLRKELEGNIRSIIGRVVRSVGKRLYQIVLDVEVVR
ncbi:MAG: class I SAM-dependent methyltransferase [Candidatus Methanomethylicaceae archaeon]